MNSYEKNLNKRKFILKQGNKLLSLANNNNQPILLDNISNSINENQLVFPKINNNINKLNIVEKNRQKDNNNQEKKILTEISKIYSLSKPKNENKIHKLKNSKFKLSKVILDSNINKSKIMESYNNSNTFKLSENDIVSSRNDNLNNNISNNKNIIHKNRNIDESIYNDSYCNNLLNINKINNSNLATQKGSIGYIFLKLDTNSLNTPKENKTKLALPNDALQKKIRQNIVRNDIFGTPSGPLRKKFPIFTANNTPENKMRFTLDKISKKITLKDSKLKKNNNINNINYRILTIKPNKNAYIIAETIGNLDYRDSHSKKNNCTLEIEESDKSNKNHLIHKKKIKVKKCPEELHFYYVGLLQEAKREGSELEGEILNSF